MGTSIIEQIEENKKTKIRQKKERELKAKLRERESLHKAEAYISMVVERFRLHPPSKYFSKDIKLKISKKDAFTYLSLTHGVIKKSVIFDCAMVFVSKSNKLYSNVVEAKKSLDSRKAKHRMVCAIVSGKDWDNSVAELGYVLIYELDSEKLYGSLTDNFCNRIKPWFEKEWKAPETTQTSMETKLKTESKIIEEIPMQKSDENTGISEYNEISTPRTIDELEKKLNMWDNRNSYLLIEYIEDMNDVNLKRFIKILVEKEKTRMNFIELVNKWNGEGRYFKRYGECVEVRTTIIGGLYALAWLLQRGEIKIYAEYERYFSHIYSLYNDPANKIYNFPTINREMVKVEDEDVVKFSLKKK